MSEFDNNVSDNEQVYETVEDPQVIDGGSTDTVAGADEDVAQSTYESAAQSTYESAAQSAGEGAQQTYSSAPDYNAAPNYSQPNYGYDNSQTYAEPQNETKVFAIISLVCGIVSLVCSCCGWLSIVLGVAAVVLGILSINKQENAKGMAIAGIVCGGVGILVAIVVIIMGSAMSALDSTEVEQMIERLEDL